ncbi:MAG: hypothetical protein LBI87_09630 [Candidatus Accumulibacter sp.]|jgi:hypothetical protein|nr:hypothetical protein [Accumulibacter sp.]
MIPKTIGHGGRGKDFGAFFNQTLAHLRHFRGIGNPAPCLQHERLQRQKMRRFAPECTRWIPAFAGMTGKRNGASAKESLPQAEAAWNESGDGRGRVDDSPHGLG